MQFLLDHPWFLGLLTAFVLAALIEVGSQMASRYKITEDPHRKDQMVALRDGLFVLVGLLVGFTLALAAGKFAERRGFLIDEANAIGTTYLRAEILPQQNRDQAQQLLRQYLDTRIKQNNEPMDSPEFASDALRARHLQDQLWAGIVDVTRTDRSAAAVAYMNSLNQVIDLREKRLSSMQNRIPISVWLLIFSISAIAVFTRGLTLVRRFWLTLALAPLTIAIVVALIADLDTPGNGLIRLDQRPLLRLRIDMGVEPPQGPH